MELVILLPMLNSRACQPGVLASWCLLAYGLLVLARQRMLVGWVLQGCSPNKSPCSLVAPRTGARPTLLLWPRAGARPAQCLRWGTDELHVLPPTFAPASSSAKMSLHSSMQQGDIALENASCKCFRGVLQMFYIDVAKVDRDVAHLQWLYTDVSSVESKCFICFRRILCVYIYSILQLVLSGCLQCLQWLYMWFQVFFVVFRKCFRRMLQVFQLFRTYITNVSSTCCKSRSDVAYVAVGPICSSRKLQLLGTPA
jgi:hypothetical protein